MDFDREIIPVAAQKVRRTRWHNTSEPSSLSKTPWGRCTGIASGNFEDKDRDKSGAAALDYSVVVSVESVTPGPRSVLSHGTCLRSRCSGYLWPIPEQFLQSYLLLRHSGWSDWSFSCLLTAFNLADAVLGPRCFPLARPSCTKSQFHVTARAPSSNELSIGHP